MASRPIVRVGGQVRTCGRHPLRLGARRLRTAMGRVFGGGFNARRRQQAGESRPAIGRRIGRPLCRASAGETPHDAGADRLGPPRPPSNTFQGRLRPSKVSRGVPGSATPPRAPKVSTDLQSLPGSRFAQGFQRFPTASNSLLGHPRGQLGPGPHALALPVAANREGHLGPRFVACRPHRPSPAPPPRPPSRGAFRGRGCARRRCVAAGERRGGGAAGLGEARRAGRGRRGGRRQEEARVRGQGGGEADDSARLGEGLP